MSNWIKLSGLNQDRWESDDDQVAVVERRPNEWYVVSIYDRFSDKSFGKSESKAIKWAKDYMRKH